MGRQAAGRRARAILLIALFLGSSALFAPAAGSPAVACEPSRRELQGCVEWEAEVTPPFSADVYTSLTASSPDRRVLYVGGFGAPDGISGTHTWVSAFDVVEQRTLWTSAQAWPAGTTAPFWMRVSPEGSQVVVGGLNSMVSFDTSNGASLWARAGERMRIAAFTLDGASLAYASDNWVTAIDAATGATRWNTSYIWAGIPPTHVPHISATAATPDGKEILVIGSAIKYGDAQAPKYFIMIRVDAQTGATRFHRVQILDHSVTTPLYPAAPHGLFYVLGGSATDTLTVRAFNGQTGDLVWSTRASFRGGTGHSLQYDPLRDVIYWMNLGIDVSVLDARTGDLRWRDVYGGPLELGANRLPEAWVRYAKQLQWDDEGRVYMTAAIHTSSRSPPEWRTAVVAFDATGDRLWDVTYGHDDGVDERAVGASISLDGRRLHVSGTRNYPGQPFVFALALDGPGSTYPPDVTHWLRL